jgi:hypothetical protein
MGRVREYETCYLSEPACSECDWFSTPLLDITNGIPEPRTTCPKCGCCTELAVGKYNVREEYAFFGLIFRSRRYLSFERKI